MSQTDTLQILKELGGRAKYRDIKNRAKDKFPNYSLYKSVSNRLNKLKTKGEIGYNAKTREWYIIQDNTVSIHPSPLLKNSS